MIHDVDAVYDRGVFRPVAPLGLPDGARVHLRVEAVDGSRAEASKRAARYATWLEGLAGRWHGDFVRDDEGDFETRESLF